MYSIIYTVNDTNSAYISATGNVVEVTLVTIVNY